MPSSLATAAAARPVAGAVVDEGLELGRGARRARRAAAAPPTATGRPRRSAPRAAGRGSRSPRRVSSSAGAFARGRVERGPHRGLLAEHEGVVDERGGEAAGVDAHLLAPDLGRLRLAGGRHLGQELLRARLVLDPGDEGRKRALARARQQSQREVALGPRQHVLGEVDRRARGRRQRAGQLRGQDRAQVRELLERLAAALELVASPRRSSGGRRAARPPGTNSKDSWAGAHSLTRDLARDPRHGHHPDQEQQQEQRGPPPRSRSAPRIERFCQKSPRRSPAHPERLLRRLQLLAQPVADGPHPGREAEPEAGLRLRLLPWLASASGLRRLGSCVGLTGRRARVDASGACF